jgi:hypothetical protein
LEVRRQLNEVLTARIILGLAAFAAAVALSFVDTTAVPPAILVILAAFVVANGPFLLLIRRGHAGRVAVAMVSLDTILVTAGVVYTGGVVSAVAIFYLWPIISASLLLPPWAAYVAAAACSGLYTAT